VEELGELAAEGARAYEEQLGAGAASIDAAVPKPGGVVLVSRHAGTTAGAGVASEHRGAWLVRMRDGRAAHIRAFFDPDQALAAADAQ
jgi:ketosteroid isomerase-like protein